MSPPVIKRHQSELQLESVAKLSSIPIVESGIYIANSVYEKIKRSNFLMGWGLDTAEHSLALATGPAISAMHLIALQPIMTIDQLLCRGIDMVEQRVPAVTLSPQIMYWNTREYVNNKFVKPLLIRADSVKMIGSQAASAAVDRLNGAIDVADQYVDHYLPPDPADKIAETDVTDSAAKSSEETSKAVRTIEHGARFSRKLQRRLTRRTLAEARALKEQGTECIHVLLYVVELVATDPKLAMQKAKELWASLSLPEPENQARPKNLEQLLVLFTRETARRLVHLVNGSSSLAARAPGRLAHALVRISHRLVSISEQILQIIPMAGKVVRKKFNERMSTLRYAIYRLNSATNHFLEQIAAYLAGRPKSSKKGLHSSVRQSNYNNHLTNAQNSTKNGID
ncbi:lipid storage droplets surface-binding protein 1 isoform X2 [Trichogramma pretiosum]|uniref:lipid storage droplets surface-binding protein 1 isoform X2 n=1 Tax=Trichogramma pretiosum TaxID=7493 RepID=UPI0006C9D90A|nr:lipid storage droplets surface-binding protein 1 isoform X2 [Trichogramma pretiosum]